MSLFSCPFRPFSSRFLVKKWNILHAFATAKPQQNRSKTAGYGHDKTVPRHEGKHGRRNREEPEKDVLLVLDKQQGKVSAVKGFDKEGQFADSAADTGRRVHAGGQERRHHQQSCRQLLQQVSGHRRAGVVPLQGIRGGTKRKGYRGQPSQPHVGGRQTDGSTPCTETGQPVIQAGLPLRPGED